MLSLLIILPCYHASFAILLLLTVQMFTILNSKDEVV